MRERIPTTLRSSSCKKEPEYDWGCEEILKSTFGLMAFQESIIKIAQEVGGFSLEDGDGVRKSASKKQMDKMLTYKDKFIKGAALKGCPEYEAVKIWNKIEAFASMVFCLAHAITYS